MMQVSVGLVHWPIKNRCGEIVATSVTNLDIHDIARACRSYGVKNYFVVNRLEGQKMFVERVLDYWKVGFGQKFNPMRKTALGMVRTASTVSDVVNSLGKTFVVSTAARSLSEIIAEVDELESKSESELVAKIDARPRDRYEIDEIKKTNFSQVQNFSFRSLRKKIAEGESSEQLLLLFGTGFGLHHSVLASSHGLLEPIWGASSDQYRHLSVRSAVSICLDRLLASW